MSNGSRVLLAVVVTILGIVGIGYWQTAQTWPTWIWIAIACVALLVLFFEGAYRYARGIETKKNDAEKALHSAEQRIVELQARPGISATGVSLGERSTVENISGVETHVTHDPNDPSTTRIRGYMDHMSGGPRRASDKDEESDADEL